MPGLQLPSDAPVAEHLGSFTMSQAKMAGSFLQTLPFTVFFLQQEELVVQSKYIRCKVAGACWFHQGQHSLQVVLLQQKFCY